MAPNANRSAASPIPNGGFLVCGLGSLGQHCVVNLKTFGVQVNAVELVAPHQWEVPQLPELLDQLVIGDCRFADVLEKAGVKRCRAILLVTENERVNLEAALTARVLNPAIRLVVRSDKQNLNELLSLQLENFVAFEPSQLSAPAFALAAYGETLLGFFRIGDYRFQVVKQRLQPNHAWVGNRYLYDLENRHRRILRHRPLVAADPEGDLLNPYSPSSQFYTWLPGTLLQAGDEIVTIDTERESLAIANATTRRRQSQRSQPSQRSQRSRDRWRQVLRWTYLRRVWKQFWGTHYEHQIQRVALLCGITVAILTVLGTGLLYWTSPNPQMSLLDAFYVTMILLLGGYGDLFGQLVSNNPYPQIIQIFSLTLTLAGTAFIGVLYALLTEKLLTLKFEFLERRPAVPEQEHVAVLWLGRVGRRVVSLLQELQQPVVGITHQSLEADVLPQMPLITGDLAIGLEKANLATAKSVVAVSDDEMQNLEMGLMAYRVNPHCRLIIRTYDQQFTDKVAQLFPYAQVLCASAISAEAFAGAAFGEHVISLFRLYHQTVMVTQYEIEAGDTLNGHLLSEIAYGYGVVPIWHQRSLKDSTIMPSDDLRLHIGDRLIVLATIRGLRRIEQGNLAPKRWYVYVERPLSAAASFEGAAELVRVSGCELPVARAFMEQLPGIFPIPMHRHQALRLVRLLRRTQIMAQVRMFNQGADPPA